MLGMLLRSGSALNFRAADPGSILGGYSAYVFPTPIMLSQQSESWRRHITSAVVPFWGYNVYTYFRYDNTRMSVCLPTGSIFPCFSLPTAVSYFSVSFSPRMWCWLPSFRTVTSNCVTWRSRVWSQVTMRSARCSARQITLVSRLGSRAGI